MTAERYGDPFDHLSEWTATVRRMLERQDKAIEELGRDSIGQSIRADKRKREIGDLRAELAALVDRVTELEGERERKAHKRAVKRLRLKRSRDSFESSTAPEPSPPSTPRPPSPNPAAYPTAPTFSSCAGTDPTPTES